MVNSKETKPKKKSNSTTKKTTKIKTVDITPEIQIFENINNKKTKENEKNIYFTVLGIIILTTVAILIFTLTYAYFTAIVKDKNPDNIDATIVAADLLVTYVDGDSNIELDSKIEPNDTFYKEFSVRNDGNDLANYTIVLEKLENTFEKDAIYENDKVTCPTEPSEDEITFTLFKLDKEHGTEIAKISTGTIPCVTPAMNVDNPFTLYTSDSVEVGTTNYYKLTIKYNNLSVDQSNNMDYGKLLAKINIIATDEQYTNEFKPTKKITTQAN